MTTLLVADDHPLFLEGIVHSISLNIPTCKVFKVESFYAAVEFMSTSPVDIVLLDRSMPGMENKRDVKDFIQKYSHIPISIISASENHVHVQEAMNIDASGYIPKTTPPEELSKAIEQLLAGKTYFPRHIRPKQTYMVSLTPGETTVLRSLDKGHSNREIAEEINRTEGTVKQHLHKAYKKLGVKNRTQALKKARELGYLEEPNE